jgi:hypothetical protein
MAMSKEQKQERRRSHYTLRIADRICESIALGDTIKEALAKEPLGPSLSAFWKWLDEYGEFREKYERARQLQADMHADDMLQCARDAINNPKNAPAYRVAADILKWQAEIRDSKKYGTKVQHELKAPPLKPDDLRAEIARLEAELGVSANTQTEPNAAKPATENPAPPAAPNPVPDIFDRPLVFKPHSWTQ